LLPGGRRRAESIARTFQVFLSPHEAAIDLLNTTLEGCTPLDGIGLGAQTISNIVGTAHGNRVGLRKALISGPRRDHIGVGHAI
jgi:hypothetical protein